MTIDKLSDADNFVREIVDAFEQMPIAAPPTGARSAHHCSTGDGYRRRGTR